MIESKLISYIFESSLEKKQYSTNVYDNFCFFKDKASSYLKDYLEGLNLDKCVLGLSGGLDSTYVALVASDSLKKMRKPSKNLILVTLPSFATGSRTFKNALSLISDIGATHININIQNLTSLALKEMALDENDRSTAFENIQARLRTSLLLTLANKHNALELGTGDFSEIVLGWCTYGGDNISMYNINATIPKTFIRESILSFGKNENKEYLKDIASSPISPELLPSLDGKELSQHTEDSIGSYDLIDTLIYFNIVQKMSIEESVKNAKVVLPEFDKYDANLNSNYIEYYASVFEKRKVTQSFKRLSCPYANLTPLKVENYGN